MMLTGLGHYWFGKGRQSRHLHNKTEATGMQLILFRLDSPEKNSQKNVMMWTIMRRFFYRVCQPLTVF